jgi:hypothetical protein
MNAGIRAFNEGFVDSLRLAAMLCYVPVKLLLMVFAILVAFVRHELVSIDNAALAKLNSDDRQDLL